MTGKAKRRAQKRQARELVGAAPAVQTSRAGRSTREVATTIAPVALSATCLALIGLFLSGWTPGSSRHAVSPALTHIPHTTAPVAAPPPPPRRAPAAELFVGNCGVCHTLRPPGTTGTAGPNLNRLRPTAARVRAAIANGGRGSGLMPPGILVGRDAERVARFVARASRR